MVLQLGNCKPDCMSSYNRGGVYPPPLWSDAGYYAAVRASAVTMAATREFCLHTDSSSNAIHKSILFHYADRSRRRIHFPAVPAVRRVWSQSRSSEAPAEGPFYGRVIVP